MSWDVLFQPLPSGIASLSDVPADFSPGPFGARSDIIARLQRCIPNVDFSDPSWGMLKTDSFVIEFNLGKNVVASSLMLHIRGGYEAFGIVREVSDALTCPAIDCSQGELIDFESPDARAGFDAWRAYRARVVSNVGE